jgi:2-polyprenyl-6-hydroxyphenyl methylase / 3-demethylubiquinone-9 3-methyltransferase
MAKSAQDAVIGPKTPTIDPDEVAKFTAMADDWWNPRGKFRPLHKFNPVRLAYLRQAIEARFGRDGKALTPFAGLRVLDIGCGGGLVTEPMSVLGANVMGVDAGESNIKAALTHARARGLDIDYRVGTVEGLKASGEGPFDIVLNLEVVEHVADPHLFVKLSAELVAPGGMMVVASINRTAKAFALAIVGAEYVLGWLPKGTHEFDKLVRPEEAQAAMLEGGLIIEPPVGVSFNPLADRWSLSEDTAVNYMVTGFRPG